MGFLDRFLKGPEGGFYTTRGRSSAVCTDGNPPGAVWRAAPSSPRRRRRFPGNHGEWRLAFILLDESKMKTPILLSLCAAGMVISAAACHKETDKPAEGPMERAGKAVDHTAEKAGDDAKDAKDTVQKKAKDAGL